MWIKIEETTLRGKWARVLSRFLREMGRKFRLLSINFLPRKISPELPLLSKGSNLQICTKIKQESRNQIAVLVVFLWVIRTVKGQWKQLSRSSSSRVSAIFRSQQLRPLLLAIIHLKISFVQVLPLCSSQSKICLTFNRRAFTTLKQIQVHF